MKSRTCTVCIAVAVMMALALCAPAWAQDQPKATVRAGYLTCHVASGWGFVFGSSQTVKCTYTRDQSHTEYHSGLMTKFGADIGYLSSAVMLWAVVPDHHLGEGALAGHYGGATASVALGVGAGANILVGGFKKSIALQPVSIEGQNGLNVAAGIAELSLSSTRKGRPKSEARRGSAHASGSAGRTWRMRDARCSTSTIFADRIDSRFLLPGRGRLPHVNCYPAAELRGGGGDGEATEHGDTTRAEGCD